MNNTFTSTNNTWTNSQLLERVNNYAFEGESIKWYVLAMDQDGIDDITKVYGSMGKTQSNGSIQVSCIENLANTTIEPSCNAQVDGQALTTFNGTFMRHYTCTFTVETADSMYGEYWLTVQANDTAQLSGTMDEYEYWFFNPVVAIGIEGGIDFPDAMPGADSYSDTLLISNEADPGSGVMLDMFISGTDFYGGTLCPASNVLSLSAFRYHATNGAYSSDDDLGTDVVDADRDTDAEGYTNIEYGIGFNDPDPFYDNAEVLQAQKVGPYYTANLLAPGADMALTFKLSLPSPCNGNFDTGSISFWGEAI